MATFPLKDVEGKPHVVTVRENPSKTEVNRWLRDWDAQSGGRGESAHWDWNDKRQPDPHGRGWAFFALTNGKTCHGMMILLWPMDSRDDEAKSLVYLDYLEVAPKHRHGPPADRKLKGVGTALFDICVLVSCKLGFAGRVGLHSLPGAEGFYRKRGLKEWPYDAYKRMIYFELVEDGEPLCP